MIFAVAGCATTMDRFEQPSAAYACAADLMEVEAPGPLPEVIWVDDLFYVGGVLAQGSYVVETNTIKVRRDFHEGVKTLVHEMTHALQAQFDRELSQPEAREAERRINECINLY